MTATDTVTVPETAQEKAARSRAEYVQGLREMADWIESHPSYREGGYWMHSGHVVFDFVDADKLAEKARAFGTADKYADDDSIGLERRFGPHKVVMYTPRDETCERIQVGTETKTVTKTVPVEELNGRRADKMLAEVTEVEEVPVYEWVCPDSLLRGA